MAKIIRFHELGGPEVLRVEERDPGEPGAGEVLVAIEAIGLNRGEAAFRGGHYIHKATLPSLLGGEAAGHVLAAGPGVEGWAPGDLFTMLPLYPIGQYGTYANETLLPAASLMRRPPSQDAISSAASWVAFLTAWGGLIETAQLAAGTFVIITAASSSVGLAAIQIAKQAGAIPIAATRGSSKASALRAAGAAHVVATEEQDIVAFVHELTAGKGVPLVFDCVAGPGVDQLSQCLAEDGMLMIYGGMANQPATFPRHLAIRRNLTLRGYNFFAMLSVPERKARAIEAILSGMDEGHFRMPIAEVFDLDNIVEAHRMLERNEHIGKIIVTTGDVGVA